MNCPNCNRPMHSDRVYADWACECGLAGPRDVLEAMTTRLAASVPVAELRALYTAHVVPAQEGQSPRMTTGGRLELLHLITSAEKASKVAARIEKEPASDTAWLEDRIADLENQLEAERGRRIEAERPAVVLAEAERLLRVEDVLLVTLSCAGVILSPRSKTGRSDHGADTLAEAVEKLRKERGDG